MHDQPHRARLLAEGFGLRRRLKVVSARRPGGADSRARYEEAQSLCLTATRLMDGIRAGVPFLDPARTGSHHVHGGPLGAMMHDVDVIQAASPWP